MPLGFNADSSLREAPLSGPPPAYAAAIRRVYPGSLRPMILFTTLLGAIYGFGSGGSRFRDISEAGETQKLKMFDIIVGALFMAVGAIEAFGFVAALMARVKIVRIYTVLATVGTGIVIAAEFLQLVLHFTLKEDLLAGCAVQNQNDKEFDNNGDLIPAPPSDIDALCTSEWERGIAWDVAWLIFGSLLATLFTIFAYAYLRQLRDPSSVVHRVARPMGGAPSSQYQYGDQPYGAYGYDANGIPLQAYPGYVPPYAAAAAAGASAGAPPMGPYGPPPGPPDRGAGSVDLPGYEGDPSNPFVGDEKEADGPGARDLEEGRRGSAGSRDSLGRAAGISGGLHGADGSNVTLRAVDEEGREGRSRSGGGA